MKNLDKKYLHLVSYMANNNINGVMEIYSMYSKIDTVTKMKETLSLISLESSEPVEDPIITSIISFKNR